MREVHSLWEKKQLKIIQPKSIQWGHINTKQLSVLLSNKIQSFNKVLRGHLRHAIEYLFRSEVPSNKCIHSGTSISHTVKPQYLYMYSDKYLHSETSLRVANYPDTCSLCHWKIDSTLFWNKICDSKFSCDHVCDIFLEENYS